MEIAQLKAVLCPQSATAARALAEAKASEQRAEQLHASAEQKEQASVAQSLSVNRERLQLATETRDITQLRQEAEQQAAEVSRTVFLHPVGTNEQGQFLCRPRRDRKSWRKTLPSSNGSWCARPSGCPASSWRP